MTCFLHYGGGLNFFSIIFHVRAWYLTLYSGECINYARRTAAHLFGACFAPSTGVFMHPGKRGTVPGDLEGQEAGAKVGRTGCPLLQVNNTYPRTGDGSPHLPQKPEYTPFPAL